MRGHLGTAAIALKTRPKDAWKMTGAGSEIGLDNENGWNMTKRFRETEENRARDDIDNGETSIFQINETLITETGR